MIAPASVALGLLLAVAQPFVVVASLVIRPTSATCPHGFYVEGARPSGRTSCVEVPPADVCNTRQGCASMWQPVRVEMRVWCDSARVTGPRSVACR